MPVDNKRGRGRPPVIHRTPDRNWFIEQMEAAGYSQGEIGRQLSKHPSLVSRGLKGKRTLSIEEAIVFSRLLRKPIDLILRKAGYAEVQAPAVPVVGKILGDGSVSHVTARRGPFSAAGYPDNAVAFVADTANSPLAAYHGAVVIVADSTQSRADFPPDAFGRLCIVEAEDHKMPLLGTLGKAPARGAVQLTIFGSNEVVALVKPLRALLVYGIIFT